MADATGLAEKMLGLDGFRVLEVHEGSAELVIHIETLPLDVLCAGCGVPAEAQDRVSVEMRDLRCFHRATRLVWRKRRWRCRVIKCSMRTWTEDSDHFPERQLLTSRAGAEACRQVGRLGRSVASVAEELGVCWATAMAAVEHHGRPLVDDPRRVGRVRSLGIDETSWLRAKPDHPTLYATGLVDLERRRMIDMVRGNAASDLRRWCRTQDEKWLRGVKVVAMDLPESYRRAQPTSLSRKACR
jgi:transposase